MSRAGSGAEIGSGSGPGAGTGSGAGAGTGEGPWDAELELQAEPHPSPDAPSVVVHAPPSFRPQTPLWLVVFLHGWNGCARVLAGSGPQPCSSSSRPRDGWGLSGRFDEAGADALLVVPQLAFAARDGSPGGFGRPGGFSAFLRETLAELEPRLGRAVGLDDVRSITLLAHSAGFESALAVLARADLAERVRHLVLFDALYRGVQPFSRWAGEREERRLVSFHTGRGRPASQSGMLASAARRALGEEAVASEADEPLGALLLGRRVIVARSAVSHGLVPATHLAEVIRALEQLESSEREGG